jgi:hypothetical protein
VSLGEIVLEGISTSQPSPTDLLGRGERGTHNEGGGRHIPLKHVPLPCLEAKVGMIPAVA